MRTLGFEWLRKDTLELVRTTSHGQRHECSRCGGVLTIVYDSQPNTIWPVAGRPFVFVRRVAARRCCAVLGCATLHCAIVPCSHTSTVAVNFKNSLI